MNRRGFLARLSALFVAPFVAELAPDSGEKFATNTTYDGALTRGDVVTFAGCYARNPITNRETDTLQRFVITHDVAAGGSFIPLEVIFPRADPHFAALVEQTADEYQVLGVRRSRLTPVRCWPLVPTVVNRVKNF